MNLEDIKTVEQAKAMAFDCIRIIETQQNNLRLLNQKMEELSNQEHEDDKTEEVLDK